MRAVAGSTGMDLRRCEVTGPLPDMKVTAEWCRVPRDEIEKGGAALEGQVIHSTGGLTGVVEMAQASGLSLLPQEARDPLVTTTRGTGELIMAAVDSGCDSVVVGMGGSATVDGGTGMARALGYRFLDGVGNDVREGGGGLAMIARIDRSGIDERLESVSFFAATDVKNPLCGRSGAARVYGPQKGASSEGVEELEAGLRNLAVVMERDLGIDVREVPGSGAAGGLGAGLMAFCGAEIHEGVEVVADVVNLRAKMVGADLVVTGEGKVDAQTAWGKTPAGVARMASARGIPAVIVGGCVLPQAYDALQDCAGVILSVSPGPQELEVAMAEAAENLEEGAATLMRAILLGKELR